MKRRQKAISYFCSRINIRKLVCALKTRKNLINRVCSIKRAKKHISTIILLHCTPFLRILSQIRNSSEREFIRSASLIITILKAFAAICALHVIGTYDTAKCNNTLSQKYNNNNVVQYIGISYKSPGKKNVLV